MRWCTDAEGELSTAIKTNPRDLHKHRKTTLKAYIPVNRSVIERIHRLRILTVKVKAGLGTRKYKVVKSDGPNDLVFQSVKDGKPMRDNNILSRWIKPAGRKCFGSA